MARWAWRGAICAAAVMVGIGAKLMNRSSAGEEFREAAHRMVAQVEGYAANKEYYDRLVDDAHDAVFNSHYHMDFSRHHDKSWVDAKRYFEDLFDRMIGAANADEAPHIAEALVKLRRERRGGGR